MAITWDNVKEGSEIGPLKKNCTTQQLVQWAAGSGDFYQIHYDKDFAQSTGLKGLIVHGALKHAFLGQLVHDWAGDGGRVKKFGCQYRAMDEPNQEIALRGVVTKKYSEGDQNFVELDVWTENPQGQKTSPGTAVVTLPARNGA